jgi:hypothetical protein
VIPNRRYENNISKGNANPYHNIDQMSKIPSSSEKNILMKLSMSSSFWKLMSAQNVRIADMKYLYINRDSDSSIIDDKLFINCLTNSSHDSSLLMEGLISFTYLLIISIFCIQDLLKLFNNTFIIKMSIMKLKNFSIYYLIKTNRIGVNKVYEI